MTTLKLTRLNEPNIEKLYEMKSALRNILEEGDFENLNTILDFQDKDGSFKLFSTYKIPSDARVDFCHEPTYICSWTRTVASSYSPLIKSLQMQGLTSAMSQHTSAHPYS